jgi:serine/threonine protein kinase
MELCVVSSEGFCTRNLQKLSCLLFPIDSFFGCLQVRNEKARRYLSSMRKKLPVPLQHKFANADPLAVRLLERLLAFDPKDRPTAEEVARLMITVFQM